MQTRSFPIADRWCVHSYYTLCPWAPDGSGRLLVAGADLETRTAEVFVLDANGNVLHQFGQNPVFESFWHTGFWQSWSPDGRFVYFQQGSFKEPRTVRRDLESGEEVSVDGDLEGIPPSGEPGFSSSHAMLYAAGYSSGVYNPDASPIPFQARDQHGISRISFDSRSSDLMLSTRQIIERLDSDELNAADAAMRKRLGPNEGLTLMTYCVRWNSQGTRCLFYMGNHCVDKRREEPRIAYVFAADRDLQNMHLVVDLSFGKRGVHWGWHPDGEHLMGYGPDPEGNGTCIATVKYDGSGYRKLVSHNSGGHPNVCPTDHNLLVTDCGGVPGSVVLMDVSEDRIMETFSPGKVNGEKEPPGRNPFRVCHHPVFHPDGRKFLINTLNGRHAAVQEITL